MRAIFRKSMKCLVLLAATLSPLQSLQGTHALCEWTGCCEAHRHDEPGDCEHETCCCHEHGEASHLVTDERSRDIAEGSDQPCRCPQRCVCQRSPLPQITSDAQEQVQPLQFAALLPPPEIGDVDVFPDRHGDRAVNECSLSAHDVCAALCRYLL